MRVSKKSTNSSTNGSANGSTVRVDSDLRSLQERLSALENRMEAKFDLMSIQLHGSQEHIVALLRQLGGSQDHTTALVQQVQATLASGGGSARFMRQGSNPSARSQGAAKLPAAGSHAELQPLLGPESGCISEADRLTFAEKLRVAQEAMQAGKGHQSKVVKEVTAFLEDPESSAPALYYSYFSILFNIFAILIGLLPFGDCRLPFHHEEIDTAIDSVLFAETAVRLMFCPNLKAFFFNSSNIIDCLSGLALLLDVVIIFRLSGEDFEVITAGALLAGVPIIRFLRLVRRFPQIQILISAFKDCLEVLPVLLYTMAVMACAFTSLIFFVEPRDNIATLSQAAWLVLTTMSTVGYGDTVPHSRFGHCFTSILMVVSSLYMAMPVGMIGYSFTQIWGNRTQILLLQGTRERLAKWGFGAYEIPRLFELFDLDESAELDIQEFLTMMMAMQIGFREEDVTELFKTIDRDSGGTIDVKEFVKTVYPAQYRYMFRRKANERFSRATSKDLCGGAAFE